MPWLHLFTSRKKYENMLIAIMMPFPTPQWHTGRRWRAMWPSEQKKGPGADYSAQGQRAWGTCRVVSEQLPSSGHRETSHYPQYHFQSQEQVHHLFFYRISVSFPNQHSITSLQRRTEIDLLSEVWVKIPALALTNCEFGKWYNPSRLPISPAEKLGYWCLPSRGIWGLDIIDR